MLKNNDVIILEGKTEFGTNFVKKNGSKFEIIKVMKWSQHQLLIKPLLSKTNENVILWVNLLPKSKNFLIKKR